MCFGVWEKRGKSDESEKAVGEAASGLATELIHLKLFSSPAYGCMRGLRVRGHRSSHWNNSSSAAWDSLICHLYYVCKGDSSFSTLFLAPQAQNMMKQDLVQDNQGHMSSRLRLNFLISCNLNTTREPHGKEHTGNTGSEPTTATPFHYFLNLLKIPGLWKAYVCHLQWLT